MGILNGFFIAVEGPDGSGKTVQVRRLAEHLRDRGLLVTETREPSDNEIGKLSRRYLKGEASLHADAIPALFAADRVDHVRRVVEPAIDLGHVVVCDRYALSNRVYRMAETSGAFFACPVCGWAGEPRDAIPVAGMSGTSSCPVCLVAPLPFSKAARERLDVALHFDRGTPAPDLTIVLAVSPLVAAERRASRGGKAETYDADRFQDRCCAAYARAAELCRSERVVLVDADGEREDVAKRVAAVVDAELLSRASAVYEGERSDGCVSTVGDGDA